MKIKNVNKILAIIMLFLTLFSVIQPVFAASGSGKWNGGQYASGMKTTDNANGTTGVIIRRLNNLNTGEKKTVFCAEHGIDFKTGATYNGVYYTPTNSNIRKACKVAYLGWYKNNGEYTVDGGILASDMKWVKWNYVFTQQYIWEILGQSNATFIKTDEQQGYVDFKNRIENEIASIERRPSFNGTTITIETGETKTITDSNGVLAEYGTIDNTKDGIRFVHQNGSNSMTISVDENTNLENYRISDSTFREWGMIKNGTEDTDTMVYFEFAQGVQDQLYCMSYNDPVTLNFSLKIEALGKLELSKLNTNGDLVDGAVLDNTEHDVIFEQKDAKTKEYVIDLKIENETTTTEFSKTDITGQKELPGAKLIVTDENNKVVDSWTSDENTHKIEGLVVGKTYILTEEIAPNQYVKATSIKFTIENNKEIKKVNMKDKIVEVTKEDISGNEIEGAKLQVLDESGNVIDEWISGKESHKVTGLEENKTYKLHEELSVGDYVKASDIEFKVTSEKENQKIVMVDKLVEVTKTDITNGNELEGAELEVSDENGNIIDKWTSTKQAHKVKGLEEGKKYILKEVKAPKNYELSNKIVKLEINDKGTFIDGIQVEEKDNTIEFTFENKKIEVPKTGDESKIKLFAGAILLSLLGIIYIIIKSKKNNHK